jgi:hypothetical protein
MQDNSSLSPGTHHFWDEAAAILSGLIGGGRYGLKIRVPHAVGEQSLDTKFGLQFVIDRGHHCISFAVMTFLFGNNMSFRKKLQVIAKVRVVSATIFPSSEWLKN